MSGKWSRLRGVLPKAPVDGDFQQKVNAAKTAQRESPNSDPDDPTYFSYDSISKADRGREYCRLRDLKDDLEEQISAINVNLEALSQMMVAQMEDEGEDLFRLDSGDSLSIKDEPYSQVEDKQAWMQWLRINNLTDLLSVHYQTMNAMVKDRLMAGSPQPAGIKVFIKQTITRRKPRG